MKNKTFFILALIGIFTLGFSAFEIDDQLQKIIKKHHLDSLSLPPEIDSNKVELGRLLFFDKLLSGNKDVSCATCHHPQFASADGLPLSIGVGGTGLGNIRKMGVNRDRVPRNAPEIFNRGDEEWHTMFWDSRISGSNEEGFETPADEKLPEGLENILAVQAMFPVTSRDEMRGERGDTTLDGEVNEIALISPAAPQMVWYRLMKRVLQYPKYRELFKAVYPGIKEEELGFQHAANAIAAFEIDAFTFNDSPWDQYVSGNKERITEEEKRGALLFYGEANCANCHSGKLMTDQKAHNIGVPQLGPGKNDTEAIDVGRYIFTGEKEDHFAFRTPPLKNVAITGPWMHNGAYKTLRDAVLHHLNPEAFLANYNEEQLSEELKDSYQNSDQLRDRILSKLDPELKNIPALNNQEVDDLLAFLNTLTDTSALHLEHLAPSEVPSGLPISD